MKELLMNRKKEFAVYIFACCLPIIDNYTRNLSMAMFFEAFQRQDVDYFTKCVIIGLGVSLFCALLFLISRFLRIKFMRDILLDVRKNAFENILSMGFRKFNKNSKDVYISNLINDVNTIEEKFFFTLLNTIFCTGNLVVGLIILAFLDINMFLITLGLTIFMYLIIRVFSKKTTELQYEVSEQSEVFTTDVSNSFTGLEIIKLNNLEDKFKGRSNNSVSRLEHKKFKANFFTDFQNGVMNTMEVGATVIIMAYLTLTFEQGDMLGILTFKLFVSNVCMWALITLFPMFNTLKASASIYKKITTCNEDDEVETIKPNKFNFNNSIEVKDLTFSYEGREIFKDANFVIEKGSKYLIKGVSGAGKSTLVKILSGIYDDYEGQILVDGVDLKTIDNKSFNNNISYIYQEVFLFEDSIRNNISLYKDVSDGDMEKAITGSGIKDIIEKKDAGLDEMITDNGKNLSGGEKQRVSIARALAKNSEILFVDEGTSALNESLGREIESTFLSLNDTVISISHRFYSGVTEKYDYVIEIKNGGITTFAASEYFKGELVC